MEITDTWKSRDWQGSEFSFETPDLKSALRKNSQADVARLMRKIWIQFWAMLGYALVSPLLMLLGPGQIDLAILSVIFLLYNLAIAAWLLVRLRRFRMPDMADETALALRATLQLSSSIRKTQIQIITFIPPVMFLIAFLVPLVVNNPEPLVLLSKPKVWIILSLGLAGVSAGAQYLGKWLTRRACSELILRLQGYLKEWEEENE